MYTGCIKTGHHDETVSVINRESEANILGKFSTNSQFTGAPTLTRGTSSIAHCTIILTSLTYLAWKCNSVHFRAHCW